ncbi:MAG: proline iminopeptidase-family hydrolase [Verrucomicrobia bacterium]|nr:proline iminopeptidase-family hydrolase [Verrucomicrobiota bacterium]MBU1734927.1 proline iminopeptidase-family hydrolase [Verrucomicrobiota bacterium]MBU1857888.1 proline iminopeptidase-family hydrolase [Verrucomicrobiota bacterium]
MIVSWKQDDNHTPEVKEGFIRVAGGKVWYRIVGADKKGIPLLTLHGGPGAPHDYFEPLEALAGDRPVIFYDQLGCGNSDRPSDTNLWTVARFVEELEQVRDSLSLGKVHLLGVSWGTMLAAEYMLRKKPEGVISLILSGPYLSSLKWIVDQQIWISQLPQNIQDTIRKYEENSNFTDQSYQDAMMVFYRKHLCRLDPWPDCLNRAFAKMGAEVYQYMWGPSEFTVTGTLKNADLTEQLSLIKVPVLFTCGEFDEATPAATRFYQSKLPGSEIYVFQGASHEHQLEKTEEYLQVARAFLKKVEK